MKSKHRIIELLSVSDCVSSRLEYSWIEDNNNNIIVEAFDSVIIVCENELIDVERNLFQAG